ncbi:TlpA family protein disulfide reductase [Chryseobacterium populi]|uniref:Thiol-disulfide isomerase-like thioredoxin n=1 Tax=Chryseobacterium populi TaxID=1144316 RepID=J2JQH6_9FLAO|nr:TlpA disulfide reductase family protein [Chryseobacterium populi]EJL70035.1 thiol-disulfide isomerase-like thioredoxin [Chryseobacterium populi]
MVRNYLKKGFITGIIFGGIIAFSFLGYIYYISKTNLATNAEFAKNKNIKDLNLQLTNLDGTPVDFTKYSNKYILMNFWATWCKPCMEEMPMFQNVYKSVKDRYVFIMVADHDLQTIEKFKNKKGYDFIFVKTDEKLLSKVGALPTTFVLDKSQNIIFSQTGSFDEEKKFRDLLLKKLK